MIRFTANVEALKNHLIIRLPGDVSEKLSSRGAVTAKGELSGVSFTVLLEPDGRGGHWFDLADLRSDRQLPAFKAGEELTIGLQPTEDWPEQKLPEVFEKALTDAVLTEVWDSLTVKARVDWLRWIRGAKAQATREKRIRTALSKLSQGDRRPCCFNTASCTVPELSKSGILLSADLIGTVFEEHRDA